MSIDFTGIKAVTIPEGVVTKIARKSDSMVLWEKPIGTLNETSWANISKIAAEGQAANYWAVGDRKAVAIRGTIGTLSLNTTYYVYILGFDHNGENNTIDFGTFMTAVKGGKSIALVDSVVYTNQTGGGKYFNMNHSGITTSGGWKGCDLRYDVLGSTNTKNGNATSTTATTPIVNTLMAALPYELRAVMKPMTVYTDNTGDASTAASNVTETVDYLPLLAEYEVFGTTTYANAAEKNYQAQYSYYANGNTPLKCRHNSTSTEVYYNLRSPASTYADSFCRVYQSGNASSTSVASYSAGIAPIFRV